MADTTAPAGKTPWHLWVVGIVSLLWNAMGAMDFIMTHMKPDVWLKAFTPAQVEYLQNFPLWSVVAWGVGTLGSFLGSVLLLLRKGLAFHLFAASLVGALFTSLYSFGLSDGLKIMEGGAGMIAFNAIIIAITVLLTVYAKNMRKNGVLR